MNNKFIRDALKLAKPHPDVLKFTQNLRPAHRCNLKVFESVLVHGSLISNEHMQKMSNHEALWPELQSHSEVIRFCKKCCDARPGLQLQDVQPSVVRLLQNVVLLEYLKLDKVYTGTARDTEVRKTEAAIIQAKHAIAPFATLDDINSIEAFGHRFAKAGIELANDKTGINYEVDLVCCCSALYSEAHVGAAEAAHESAGVQHRWASHWRILRV